MTTATAFSTSTERTYGVLTLDCDPQTVAALRYGGYEVASASTVKRAGSLLRRRPFSAVVLGNGDAESAPVSVTELRLRTDLPIVVIGTRGDPLHEVRVLDAGADDFVREPLDVEGLLARLRARLRRSVESEPEAPVETDAFTIDLAERQVKLSDGQSCGLSPLEWRLVELLTHHAGHLVPHDVVLTTLWGSTGSRKGYHLRTLMSGLRHKLEPEPSHPRYFVTAPGLGVKFVPGSHDPPSKN